MTAHRCGTGKPQAERTTFADEKRLKLESPVLDQIRKLEVYDRFLT